jgi:hypothetical protein
MRRLLLVIAVVGGIAFLYSCWALYRSSPRVIVYDPAWPRCLPYPDSILLALNGFYDRRYPAPRGTVKLQEEFDRVITTVQVSIVVSALVTGAGAAPLIRSVARRRSGASRRGFDVAPPRE